MAIAKMTKVMIVTHKSQSQDLIEEIQSSGLVQILDAERSMVTKEWPELQMQKQRPKEYEELIGRLDRSIEFLKGYSTGKPQTTALKPRVVVDKKRYDQVINDPEVFELLKTAETLETEINLVKEEIENTSGRLFTLQPWKTLSIAVEEMAELDTSTVFTGMIPHQHFAIIEENLDQAGASIEVVSTTKTGNACIVVCFNDAASDINKVLRAGDFESVVFSGMTGTIADNIQTIKQTLKVKKDNLASLEAKAADLSGNVVDLQIYYDHNANALDRELARRNAPATEHAILYEGWISKKDYSKVEKIVSQFDSSAISEVEPAEGEKVPVLIQNRHLIKPFEVITRLYGMPKYVELDPTALLTPFFALFFALCLTDAGYGIILVGICYFILKKMQASSKLLVMLMLCSLLTIAAGALTGGWFGAGLEEFAIAKNIDWLANGIDKMRIVDPLKNPMPFLKLSILLGYIQIMVGLLTGFLHNFKMKAYIAGLCDHFSWLLIINGVVVAALAGSNGIPTVTRPICLAMVAIGAILVVSGSHREGGIGARVGMGLYNLTGAIFYVGDILSYLRLMALGLGTAGVAIAINIIAKLVIGIPYVGFVLAGLVLIGGHLFNIAMSALGAFIHSLRLQFVEFFPKFIEGGGTEFEPLSKGYKHIYVETK